MTSRCVCVPPLGCLSLACSIELFLTPSTLCCVLEQGDNVFLRNGVAKLADFGLAQEGGARGQAGAYAYESPEQARGEPYDGKNDVWALGTLLALQ